MDVAADEQSKRARRRAGCGKRLPKNIEKNSEFGLDGLMAMLAFGPFRLDGESEILFRGNEPVPLGRRAVALLRVLVERSGTPVSKDALVEAGWAGLAVDDSNLTVQIAALRRVFGAEAGGESWIETLPRRGYRFLGPQVTKQAAGTGSQVAAALAPPKNRPSIVVMPFTNMSGDPDQEYFADGMVEEIITGLARIKWLSVVSRSTSLVYKNKPVDVKDVAEKLGVSYLLEGGVRKSGNRVRITAQLIDAEAGTQLWADKYDRMLEICSNSRTRLRCAWSAPSSRASGKRKSIASSGKGPAPSAPMISYCDRSSLSLLACPRRRQKRSRCSNKP
jgi:TolB-like protein